MKTKIIGAIDIGTSKVCSLIAETDGTGLRVLGVGVTPSQGILKGHVVNIGEAIEAIRNSVKIAERTANCRMETATVSITGKHITSDNKRGVVSITGNRNQTVQPSDLKRALDISRNEEIPPDQTILHQIPRYYRVDGQDGVNDPVGMHGYRLDVESHTITAAVNSVENLAKCVSGAGVRIDTIVFEPLASGIAVLSEDEKRDGVLLADIGSGTSNIAAYKNDSIFYSSVVPVAGNQISRDISLGLGISPELAEELKLRYGSLIPAPDMENIKTPIHNGQNVPYKDIFDIIHIRTEELIRLIILQMQNEIENSEAPASFLNSGIVLTGGTANLPGITDLVQEITGMACRIGYPPEVSGIADNLHNPAYAASFGLLIWKLGNPDTRYRQQAPVRATANKGLFNRILHSLFKK